jgi:hypothetical protein
LQESHAWCERIVQDSRKRTPGTEKRRGHLGQNKQDRTTGQNSHERIWDRITRTGQPGPQPGQGSPDRIASTGQIGQVSRDRTARREQRGQVSRYKTAGTVSWTGHRRQVRQARKVGRGPYFVHACV